MIQTLERESNNEHLTGYKHSNGATESLDELTAEQFLSLVGSRVRKNRMDISMSRKLLAKRSGVSERYLAQLESGQGNISIKLLRKVSLAIGVGLDKLMSDQISYAGEHCEGISGQS